MGSRTCFTIENQHASLARGSRFYFNTIQMVRPVTSSQMPTHAVHFKGSFATMIEKPKRAKKVRRKKES